MKGNGLFSSAMIENYNAHQRLCRITKRSPFGFGVFKVI